MDRGYTPRQFIGLPTASTDRVVADISPPLLGPYAACPLEGSVVVDALRGAYSRHITYLVETRTPLAIGRLDVYGDI